MKKLLILTLISLNTYAVEAIRKDPPKIVCVLPYAQPKVIHGVLIQNEGNLYLIKSEQGNTYFVNGDFCQLKN